MPKIFFLGFLIFCCTSLAAANSIAVIVPNETETSVRFTDQFTIAIGSHARLIDQSMAASAFKGSAPKDPLNMTVVEARNLGASIGCNGYFIIWADTYRRSLYDRKEYYEAFAAIYAVSSRTGRLVDWQLLKTEEDTPKKALEELLKLSSAAAGSMTERLLNEPVTAKDILTADRLEILPEDGPGGRMPVPYRRIRPESTTNAFLFDIEATVEVIVELNNEGTILAADTYRWAGFGLNDAAIKAIRSMNWRPAETNGRPAASRFIVRYNFKKLTK